MTHGGQKFVFDLRGLLGVVTGVKDVANAALPRSTGPLDELDRTPPPDRADRTVRVTDRTPPPA